MEGMGKEENGRLWMDEMKEEKNKSKIQGNKGNGK